ncbi:MAG: hypothetical protein F6K17_01960 [Okeania sp. SIO3C4]|nr:hypothetical protein [Okeania sp. SIO3B3]NER01481.1 hypothetical protein [Okeania sp. SIO3C4]
MEVLYSVGYNGDIYTGFGITYKIYLVLIVWDKYYLEAIAFLKIFCD